MLTEPWIDRVREVARYVHQHDHLFVIGRGSAYPTALEAALKIKEVSYIHAEGFAGGELKHGVIALIAPGTPCVVYAPNDETQRGYSFRSDGAQKPRRVHHRHRSRESIRSSMFTSRFPTWATPRRW